MLYPPLSETRLNTTLEQQKANTFYYNDSWLSMLTKLYGFSIISLKTVDASGDISGLLPLCLVRSPLIGKRLVALPFSDYCPLLATDQVAADSLINQAIELARQEKVRYLELRTGMNESLASRTDMTESMLYVRWLIDLSTDTDMLWSRLRKPVQRQVKKARGAGVQVRVAQDREDMAHYYRLHLQTRSKKHGMPAQPQRFFYELWDNFAENGELQLLLAEYQGNVIAGMILLASGATVRYAYGASDERYLSLGPNNLLMWTAISESGTRGYSRLDLGRTACDNHGLMEFKRRWGAIEEQLPYYYYPHTAGLATTSEQSWKFRVLTACWRQLPLQITEALGAYLYKYLG